MGANVEAQTPDSVYMPNVYSVKLSLKGNQLAYPIITLNSNDQLELSFDDLAAVNATERTPGPNHHKRHQKKGHGGPGGCANFKTTMVLPKPRAARRA